MLSYVIQHLSKHTPIKYVLVFYMATARLEKKREKNSLITSLNNVSVPKWYALILHLALLPFSLVQDVYYYITLGNRQKLETLIKIVNQKFF